MTGRLICIHQTIYCLLIQPNPDSALNAAAGHLLQDDYDSFARQARLMTSIHASIPHALNDEVMAAKRRRKTAGTVIGEDGEDGEQRPKMKGTAGSSLSNVEMRMLPEHVTSTHSAPTNPRQAIEDEGLASEDEDDKSASKENNSLPASSPALGSSLRRASLAKRPLSDLPIVEPEHEVIDAACSSPSEQNIVNNTNQLTNMDASISSRKGLQSAERSQSVNMTGRGLQETRGNGMETVDLEGRPSKRICSDSGKENTLMTWEAVKLMEKPLPAFSEATKTGVSASRNAPASSSSGTSSVKGKSRVGLRRL